MSALQLTRRKLERCVRNEGSNSNNKVYLEKPPGLAAAAVQPDLPQLKLHALFMCIPGDADIGERGREREGASARGGSTW